MHAIPSMTKTNEDFCFLCHFTSLLSGLILRVPNIAEAVETYKIQTGQNGQNLSEWTDGIWERPGCQLRNFISVIGSVEKC